MRHPRLRLLPALGLAVGTAALPVTAMVGASAPPSGVGGELTVFAAASLTNSFEALGEAFTAANPDVDVVFSFAASSDLVTQITEGAPADVFASADLANMDRLVEEGANGGPAVTFATNSLQIIVEPGNPQGITGIADLAANPDLIVVSCAPEVPIGAYTRQVFENAGIDVEFESIIDSFEENVRAVSEKVQLGEADAGVVYSTDVIAAGDAAEGVEIPADINVVAEYPIATTAESANPDAGAAFVEFVLSAEGQDILAGYGFGAPDAAAEAAPATTAA